MAQVNPQIESLVEQSPETKRAAPNLLVQGLRLVLRNWPFLVWAYLINLAFSLLSGIPIARGLAPYLDHSLAAQKISGTIDTNTILELVTHLRESSFFPIAAQSTGWLTLIQLLFLFVFFCGTIFVYVSAEPPRFSVLVRGGIAYFFRFVRAAVAAVCVSSVILGILIALRSLLIFRASAVYVERKMFLYSSISGAVVFLAAMLVRLWWDLVEVYVVRNAIDGERRVRQALLPAARLLYRYFFRAAGSFFLIGIIGLDALALCLFLWKLLPAHQVWLAGLLAQTGLFLLLASRFWQRGMEAALVMSIDPPMIAAEDVDAAEEDEEEVRVPGEDVLASLTEPTLRDLVNKLRDEPWATTEPVIPPTLIAPEPKIVDDPKVSVIDRMDRHATKFPLGGPQKVEPQKSEVPKVEALKTETEARNPPEPAASKQPPSPPKPSK
jgi:hypothetical protein